MDQDKISKYSAFFVSDKTGENRVSIADDNFILIQQTGSYTNWDDYKNKVLKTFKSYKKTTRCKKLERVGLRYINRIDIPDSPVTIKKYFNLGPSFRGPLEGTTMIDFSLESTLSFNQNNDYCIIKQRVVTPEIKKKQKNRVILDLYYNTFNPIEIKDFDVWLEQAHTNIDELFSKCVTDATKSTFNGGIE